MNNEYLTLTVSHETYIGNIKYYIRFHKTLHLHDAHDSVFPNATKFAENGTSQLFTELKKENISVTASIFKQLD